MKLPYWNSSSSVARNGRELVLCDHTNDRDLITTAPSNPNQGIVTEQEKPNHLRLRKTCQVKKGESKQRVDIQSNPPFHAIISSRGGNKLVNEL